MEKEGMAYMDQLNAFVDAKFEPHDYKTYMAKVTNGAERLQLGGTHYKDSLEWFNKALEDYEICHKSHPDFVEKVADERKDIHDPLENFMVDMAEYICVVGLPTIYEKMGTANFYLDNPKEGVDLYVKAWGEAKKDIEKTEIKEALESLEKNLPKYKAQYDDISKKLK